MEFGFREGLRFLYIWDKECPSRTLTISRKLEGATLLTTYCVNKVVLSEVAYQKDSYVPRNIVLDPFDKRKARHICSARFDAGGDHIVRVPVVKGQRHIATIIDYYARRGLVPTTPGDANKEAYHRPNLRISDTAAGVCGRSILFTSRTREEARRIERGLSPLRRFGDLIAQSQYTVPVQVTDTTPVLPTPSDVT